MTIPFLSFFKKKSMQSAPAAEITPPPPPLEKPSSERLSKTVLPNATRTITQEDPFAAAASTAVQTSNSLAAAAPGALRMVSFEGAASEPRIPPAVALALEPKIERVISLELHDVVAEIPRGWTRPVSDAEGSRRVLLKAAELEKGMSSGRPAVSLTSIYHQVPEIFVQPVPESEGTTVPLPVQKVLQEFTNLHTRADQTRENTVPQVETPFLRVTLEDNSRFGMPMGPIETSVMPPVNIEPATAETIAAAMPEAVAQERMRLAPLAARKPIKLPANGGSASPAVQTETTGHPPTVAFEKSPTPDRAPQAPDAAPTRIPFKLSPTGPDVPASERVPASSGPSVPTSFASPSGAPTRIPFKLGVSNGADTPATADTWITKESFGDGETLLDAGMQSPAAEPVPSQPETKILLPLKPVLQGLPPFQLTGDVGPVPDDARFEVSFALVEPQLAAGRIVIEPDQFASALPEEYKNLFSSKEIAAPVVLPLQDILKNLPAASLRMRDDQVEQEKGDDFETPFAAKAQEDARRFKVSATPVPKRSEIVLESSDSTAPAPADENAEASNQVADTEGAEATPATPRTALQDALDTDAELDAKAVITHVEKMSGVKSCALMFGDGLSLAGNLPAEYEADGLCAMAPTFFQRTESHLLQTKLGSLRTLTLECEKGAVSIFTHDNLCLAALHTEEGLAVDVKQRLGQTVHELSRKYSHPV